MTADTRQKRQTAVDLLDTGLTLLAAHGLERLTIDALCSRLKVTKGSFYHHFKGRDEYLERLLAHWVETNTVQGIAEVKKLRTPQERYAAIVAFSDSMTHNLEASIRAWAIRDDMVAAVLETVDTLRLEYLADVFSDMGWDRETAETRARLDYAAMLGIRVMFPKVEPEMKLRMVRELCRTWGIAPAN